MRIKKMRCLMGIWILVFLGLSAPVPAEGVGSGVALADVSGPWESTFPTRGGETHREVSPTSAQAGEWEHIHEGPYGEALLRVERELRCNCGCMLDVHSCQFQMQCGTSPQWSQRILRLLEDGQSEDAILAGFTAEFGPNVRMTLPTQGFNWVGYLLPWTAILVVGGLVVGFLRRRVAPANADPDRGISRVSTEDWERIREELRRLEDEEKADDF
jgi:cytochrome c-type biogenesis protein CcmH/NrfF